MEQININNLNDEISRLLRLSFKKILNSQLNINDLYTYKDGNNDIQCPICSISSYCYCFNYGNFKDVKKYFEDGKRELIIINAYEANNKTPFKKIKGETYQILFNDNLYNKYCKYDYFISEELEFYYKSNEAIIKHLKNEQNKSLFKYYEDLKSDYQDKELFKIREINRMKIFNRKIDGCEYVNYEINKRMMEPIMELLSINLLNIFRLDLIAEYCINYGQCKKYKTRANYANLHRTPVTRVSKNGNVSTYRRWTKDYKKNDPFLIREIIIYQLNKSLNQGTI